MVMGRDMCSGMEIEMGDETGDADKDGHEGVDGDRTPTN